MVDTIKAKSIVRRNDDFPLISIITVVYNGIINIEETILSVINQTYSNIEYIIIDGGSTDGTLSIIKRYEKDITFLVSESDEGIYDAMNKGILLSTGKWILFMNCGDYFPHNNVINTVFSLDDYIDIDIIYGNSVMIDINGKLHEKIARDDVKELCVHPIYRHGASFVKSSLHKNFLFEINLSSKFSYSLDFLNIYKFFLTGKKFQKVDVSIVVFLKDGVSNSLFKNIWYNFLITTNGIKSPLEILNWMFKLVRYKLF
ncbi:glycosyltransferase family 2 protein [Spirosoma humi]